MKSKLALGVTGGLLALSSYGASFYYYNRVRTLPQAQEASKNAFLTAETIIKDNFATDPRGASQRCLESLERVDPRFCDGAYSYTLRNLADVASGAVPVEASVIPSVRNHVEKQFVEQQDYIERQSSELGRRYSGRSFHIFFWGGGIGAGMAIGSLLDYASQRRNRRIG